MRPGSPATNFSDVDPVTAGLATRTTQIDDRRDDDDTLDTGFHYAPGTFSDLPALAADCNGDACVRIDELISAVRIALDQSPLRVCPAADLNGDNHVDVNELVTAVRDAFCCAQHRTSR